MIRTSDLERFISDFEERLAPVEKAADEAWWNLATVGTDETREEFVAAGKAYSDLFSDTDEYGKLRDLFENLQSVESPLLRRRIEVLYRMFEERQGDEETLGRIEELEAEANASLTARTKFCSTNRVMLMDAIRELSMDYERCPDNHCFG